MKHMPIREFLRGGYQNLTEPTVILSRGYPKFTVFPGPPRITPAKTDFHTDERRDSIPPGSPGPSPNGG